MEKKVGRRARLTFILASGFIFHYRNLKYISGETSARGSKSMRLKASRRELAGKLKKHVVRREVKKSTRGGKEGGAQDAKRVADKVAHMQIFLDIHV